MFSLSLSLSIGNLALFVCFLNIATVYYFFARFSNIFPKNISSYLYFLDLEAAYDCPHLSRIFCYIEYFSLAHFQNILPKNIKSVMFPGSCSWKSLRSYSSRIVHNRQLLHLYFQTLATVYYCLGRHVTEYFVYISLVVFSGCCNRILVHSHIQNLA